MIIVTGLVAPATMNAEQAVKIGKAQTVSFEKSLPLGFYGPISKQVVTKNAAKKSVKVRGKGVFVVNLIYSRVLGLQQSRDIDLSDVLKHELSPIPTAIFKENGEMRNATGKSSLKKKLNVTVSSRHVREEVTIMMGVPFFGVCTGHVKELLKSKLTISVLTYFREPSMQMSTSCSTAIVSTVLKVERNQRDLVSMPVGTIDSNCPVHFHHRK